MRKMSARAKSNPFSVRLQRWALPACATHFPSHCHLERSEAKSKDLPVWEVEILRLASGSLLNDKDLYHG